MSIHSIHLWKLLRLLQLDDRGVQSLLREDIRTHLRKERGIAGGGGDFHGAFWKDAKLFVSDAVDLNALTLARVAGNASRRRLYPQLAESFLSWWHEKRRWSNEPFAVHDISVHGRYQPEGIAATIKVENLLAIRVGGTSERLIYPYFSEEPMLGDSAARIGLWVISQALKEHEVQDMRILDILRSKSFAVRDYPLVGDEEEALVRHFSKILEKWDLLREEYTDNAA